MTLLPDPEGAEWSQINPYGSGVGVVLRVKDPDTGRDIFEWSMARRCPNIECDLQQAMANLPLKQTILKRFWKRHPHAPKKKTL